MTIDCRQIAESLQLRPEQVAGCVALLDEGNTVPFITRYRKERTGNLDEEQIRRIRDLMTAQRQLQERAANIIRLIDSRGQLTAELRAAIEQAETLKRLEDLYLPFRPKRTSRAEQARERGLEPLAVQVRQGDPALEDLESAAVPFLNPEQELNSTEDVLRGVHDIIAEQIGDDPDVRSVCRRVARQTGRLEVRRTKKAADKDQEFRDYFEYDESIRGIPPHRVLAVNRGEKAGVLKVRFRWDDTRARVSVQMQLRTPDHRFAEFLEECVADAISRLILPSLEREVRRELNEQAESHAVTVFARNLRNLLLQPPVRDRRVLAIDPGFRTGCKLAMLDGLGNPLMTGITHVTGSVEKKAAARRQIADLLREHDCRLIAIGNGTACRETEELVAEVIATEVEDAAYVIVNEAGASVYSTSPAARDEFPDSDATVRGTISIGRRLQDPLSELVKIDAQHLGVGMYQHDLNERRLKEQLTEVIESCVNYVGVDLNTASTSLLKHVSGLNQLIARRVVEWRKVHGRFENRQQLLDVQGVGEATFTQAAGFLHISDGDEPLDSTWIHPESYPAARSLLERAQVDAAQLTASGDAAAPAQETLRSLDARETASELAIGVPTFQDILDALLRPGRDPRVELPEPLFRKGVLKLEDLEIGMELTGTVLNVVDFGAFIDVGLKDSGLVHISQMATDFVHSPHDRVCVGDRVTVWVLEVDLERRRVSLTMIPPQDSPTTAGR